MNRTVVVGALIAGLATIVFIGPRLIRGDASDALVGLAVLTCIFALYAIEVWLDAHLRTRRRSRTREGIQRLIAMASSNEATERQARREFKKIHTKDGLQPLLLDEPGLEAAAGTPGPHQVHLLRLVLVYLWPNSEPWRTLIADGEHLLMEDAVSRRELSFLPAWQEARNTGGDA